MPDALLITKAGTALFKLLGFEFRRFSNKFAPVHSRHFGLSPHYVSLHKRMTGSSLHF